MNRTLLSIALTPAFPFPGYDPAIGGRLGDGVNVNDTAYNARPLRFEYWRAGDSAMHALDSRKWVGRARNLMQDVPGRAYRRVDANLER